MQSRGAVLSAQLVCKHSGHDVETMTFVCSMKRDAATPRSHWSDWWKAALAAGGKVCGRDVLRSRSEVTIIAFTTLDGVDGTGSYGGENPRSATVAINGAHRRLSPGTFVSWTIDSLHSSSLRAFLRLPFAVDKAEDSCDLLDMLSVALMVNSADRMLATRYDLKGGIEY